MSEQDQLQDTKKVVAPVQVLGPEEIRQEFINMKAMIDAAVPSDVDHMNMVEALAGLAEMVDVLVDVMRDERDGAIRDRLTLEENMARIRLTDDRVLAVWRDAYDAGFEEGEENTLGDQAQEVYRQAKEVIAHNLDEIFENNKPWPMLLDLAEFLRDGCESDNTLDMLRDLIEKMEGQSDE